VAVCVLAIAIGCNGNVSKAKADGAAGASAEGSAGSDGGAAGIMGGGAAGAAGGAGGAVSGSGGTGGGTEGTSDGAAGAGDGDAGAGADAASTSEEGIFATIGGVKKAFTVDLSADLLATSHNLFVSARITRTTEKMEVDILLAARTDGTYTCMIGGAGLKYWSPEADGGSTLYRASSTQGDCMVTLTNEATATGEFFEGFFTGMLVPDGGGAVAYTITDGTFRLKR
jgi:hypothetical protein